MLVKVSVNLGNYGKEWLGAKNSYERKERKLKNKIKINPFHCFLHQVFKWQKILNIVLANIHTHDNFQKLP